MTLRILILVILCLLAPLRAVGSSFFATPSGGDYGGGQLIQIINHHPVVVHTFCAPRAYACQQDGATPIADLIPMPDGSFIGAVQVGGDFYQPWPGGGAVYRLAPDSAGGWAYTVLFYLCPWEGVGGPDCSKYGQVQAIWRVDDETIGGYNSNGEQGVEWVLKLMPYPHFPLWRRVQHWW